MEFHHVPIMANEVIELLRIKNGGVYLDGTLGGGGHARLICERMGSGHLIGIDRDISAIKAAGERLNEFSIQLINDNYVNVKHLIGTKLSGVLLDLGVSSHQFDEAERGFSYRYEAVLDMRMDRRSALTAHDVVNKYDFEELVRVLRDYGEEKKASSIARKIISNRPIETTTQLVEVIKSAFSPKERFEGKHPAKRSFQGIRIEVNDELSKLGQAISDLADMLESGGRLAIITFHSLEDRIVKNMFVKLATGCVCPKGFPVCVCGGESKFKVTTKKPIVPCDEEVRDNPRSTCAKLRVLERI